MNDLPALCSDNCYIELFRVLENVTYLMLVGDDLPDITCLSVPLEIPVLRSIDAFVVFELGAQFVGSVGLPSDCKFQRISSI